MGLLQGGGEAGMPGTGLRNRSYDKDHLYACKGLDLINVSFITYLHDCILCSKSKETTVLYPMPNNAL